MATFFSFSKSIVKKTEKVTTPYYLLHFLQFDPYTNSLTQRHAQKKKTWMSKKISHVKISCKNHVKTSYLKEIMSKKNHVKKHVNHFKSCGMVKKICQHIIQCYNR